jgi:hypothetical protein
MKKLNFLLCLFFGICVMNACKSKEKNHGITGLNTALLTDTLKMTTAKRLVKNFDGRTKQISKGGLVSSDTRTVWFSLKQLKPLIERIEAEGGDGIRFYLAAYDKTAKTDIKTKSNYFDFTTLVMVSTRDSLGKHFDYFYDGKIKNRKGGIITATPENQGELCPPPAHCIDEGALLLQP